MKLNIEFDKEKIINFLQTSFKTLTYCLYSWFTTDGEILGYILGIWHIIVCISILICVFLSHTVYPFVWFQLGCFICLFCIWLQHIILHVCVVFLAEVHLTNKTPPFYTVIENVTGIRLEDYQSYALVAETTAIGCFFLELVGKFSLYIFESYTKNASAVR